MPDLDDIRSAFARIPNPIAVLEALFARAPIGLQIYEASGHSLLVNQAFLDLFGSEPPPGYNVLKDEIAVKNGVLELIHRAFSGETVTLPPVWYDPRELEQVRMEKGNRVAIESTFVPLFDRTGRVSHVAIFFRDLTAQLIHRASLEEERALLAAIVDQVSDGIVMADPDGTLRLVNAAARAVGLRPGSTIASHAGVAQVLTSDGHRMALSDSPLSRALRGEKGTGTVHLTTPSGEMRALAAMATPLLREDGSPRGAVVTFRDETERLRHEQETRETADVRERFMGVLGHDLRSPLASILASAGLVLRHEGLPEPVRSAAERIERSAQRMGRMIRELLDFTQARSGGGLPLRPSQCDLAKVARAAVEEALTAHPGRDVQLACEGDPNGSFDADRAMQLLGNLLSNALAYAPAGTPIVVEVLGKPAVVELVVRNGGPPIAGDELKYIFDPFRRGSAASNTQGLGLGLFIVRQIARAHGGDVTVRSTMQETEFRAMLPRQR